MVKSRAQASQRETSDKVDASCSLTLSFRRRKNSFKMRKMSESESDVGSPSGSLFYTMRHSPKTGKEQQG